MSNQRSWRQTLSLGPSWILCSFTCIRGAGRAIPVGRVNLLETAAVTVHFTFGNQVKLRRPTSRSEHRNNRRKFSCAAGQPGVCFGATPNSSTTYFSMGNCFASYTTTYTTDSDGNLVVTACPTTYSGSCDEDMMMGPVTHYPSEAEAVRGCAERFGGSLSSGRRKERGFLFQSRALLS